VARTPNPIGDAVAREEIYVAALRIVRQEGTDSLTVRNLCQALDRTPPAIYRLIGSKQQLVDELFDRVILGGIDSAPLADSWEESLANLVIGVRDALAACPGLSLTVRGRDPSRTSLQLTERILGLLEQGGLGPAEGMEAWYVLHTYFFGHLVVQPGNRSRRGADQRPPNRTADYLRRHPVAPATFPRLAAVGSGPLVEDRAMFIGGLRRLIAGLAGPTAGTAGEASRSGSHAPRRGGAR
jgi:TetR/AcrR family tetracycline transcriptional repressor